MDRKLCWERLSRSFEKYTGELIFPTGSPSKNSTRLTEAGLMEKNIIKQSPSRVEKLIKIFVLTTELEIEFWEMDLHER